MKFIEDFGGFERWLVVDLKYWFGSLGLVNY